MHKQYPSIVVQSHRYRGPMESKKDSDFIEDALCSLDMVRKMFVDVRKSASSLQQDVDMLNNEKSQFHQELNGCNQRLSALKGGEL